MFTASPLQIVSTFGVTRSRAVGSTHTYAVSLIPVHFSPSFEAWRVYGVMINFTSCALFVVFTMILVRGSSTRRLLPAAGVTVTPAGASVTYRNRTGLVGTVGL